MALLWPCCTQYSTSDPVFPFAFPRAALDLSVSRQGRTGVLDPSNAKATIGMRSKFLFFHFPPLESTEQCWEGKSEKWEEREKEKKTWLNYSWLTYMDGPELLVTPWICKSINHVSQSCQIDRPAKPLGQRLKGPNPRQAWLICQCWRRQSWWPPHLQQTCNFNRLMANSTSRHEAIHTLLAFSSSSSPGTQIRLKIRRPSWCCQSLCRALLLWWSEVFWPISWQRRHPPVKVDDALWYHDI